LSGAFAIKVREGADFFFIFALQKSRKHLALLEASDGNISMPQLMQSAKPLAVIIENNQKWKKYYSISF
jgi:hypothetical protein